MANGTIAIEESEIEGLAEQLDTVLDYVGEGLGDAADRQAYVRYLAELVDLESMLARAGSGPTQVPRTEVVEDLIRRGAEDAPSRFGEALRGLCDDQQATMRQAKGLLSLGCREGLYRGVMI